MSSESSSNTLRFWQTPDGLDAIDAIVKKRVGQWENSLRESQRDIVSKIMDEEDILWITATGDGKSAAFTIPILIHDEVHASPELYSSFQPREHAVGLVVTPTKGLAANIVLELAAFGIPAFAYTAENLADIRKARINIVKEISECQTYRITCVDPEHLKSKEWREIINSPIFRKNIIFACAEEAHLIDEWGNPDFRPQFRSIGYFFRGRLPSSVSFFALSATVEPGKSTKLICDTLGFKAPYFHLIRCSNERVNIQIAIVPLLHGLGSNQFPELLSFLSLGRKTIIHCQTIDTIYRVFVYLWQFLPNNHETLRYMRVYHSICSAEYNQETLRLLDSDPLCLVVIAMVAFSNGINCRSLLDSISIGPPSTLNRGLQEKGRVGRNSADTGRGIFLVSPAEIAKAKKFIEAKDKNVSTKITMNNSTALFLAETKCYTACINKIYLNPPIEISSLDCISAGRLILCSLCAECTNTELSITCNPSPFPSPVIKLHLLDLV